MPFAKCPTCKQTYHLSVKDVEKWYAEQHPNLNFGEIPIEKCYGCWVEVLKGDIINPIVKSELETKVNYEMVGTIIDKIESIETIYLIEFSDGNQKQFKRENICKRLNQK